MAERRGDPRTPAPPPGWPGRPSLRERLASASLRAASRLGGAHYVGLEYQPPQQSEPRWGWTRPPHPGLAELLRARRARFRTVLRLVEAHAAELERIPHWDQDWFTGLDAAVLYSFLREREPAQLIEIGSGHSTLFAARAVRDGDLPTRITSIDPAPRTEIDEVCDEVVRAPLQEAGLERFFELEAGDVVLVDSSHHALRNSDATAFFLDVLPELPAGVLVGIHDVFLPDDYPWWLADRWYSEQYLLAAWLLGAGESAEVVFAAHFAATDEELRPEADRAFDGVRSEVFAAYGSSFWIETT